MVWDSQPECELRGYNDIVCMNPKIKNERVLIIKQVFFSLFTQSRGLGRDPPIEEGLGWGLASGCTCLLHTGVMSSRLQLKKTGFIARDAKSSLYHQQHIHVNLSHKLKH